MLAAVSSAASSPGPTETSRPEQAGLGGPFWRLWWANSVDNVGDGIWATALPLLAALLSSDPRLVAGVSAATFLPWLLLSLPVGAVVDRNDRIRLMWIAQWFQFSVASVVTVAVATHAASIWLLCVAGFLLGCAEVVVGNAVQSVLPELVVNAELVRANSRLGMSQTVAATFVGPPIGSLLFATATWLAFGLNAASFAGSALLLLLLRRRKPAPRIVGSGARMGTDIAEGLRWLARHALLRTIAIVFAVNCLTNQIAMSTMVLLALDGYGSSAKTYGLLLVGMALGAIIGGLVNGKLAHWLGTLGAMLLALAVNAAAYLAIGIAPGLASFAALLAVSGMCVTIWNVTSVSLRQRIVPLELLGRVNSVYRMLGWGLFSVGAVIGGFLAHTISLQAPYPIAGALRVLGLLAALPILFPAARSRRAAA